MRCCCCLFIITHWLRFDLFIVEFGLRLFCHCLLFMLAQSSSFGVAIVNNVTYIMYITCTIMIHVYHFEFGVLSHEILFIFALIRIVAFCCDALNQYRHIEDISKACVVLDLL